MAAGKLNTRSVAAAKAGRHGDGAGLYLIVSPSGTKKWVFRFSWREKVTEMGLGSADVVALAEARVLRDDARKVLVSGRNPIEVRKEAGRVIPTFGVLADEIFEAKKSEWRHAVHVAQWERTVKVYCAALRQKSADSITTEDVLAVLTPLWVEKNETATRVRQRIESILDAAKARGFRSGENPAAWRGHLQHLLPKRRRIAKAHFNAMPYEDLPAFFERLRRDDCTGALALAFTILTGSRSNEVFGARWEEVDLDARIWTVPKERTKPGREHRVPLSAPALDVLEKMATAKRGKIIFPSSRGDRPLSESAMRKVLERMGVENVTVHGFRSSFRDWAGHETNFPREIAEQALSHRLGDAAELAYRRGDYLEKRRGLMTAWASYLDSNPTTAAQRQPAAPGRPSRKPYRP